MARRDHRAATKPRAEGAAGAGPRFSIICLSSQDWNAPLPTNRQQIMARAALRGHRVIFVETGDFAGKHLLRLVRGPSRLSLARRLLAAEHVTTGVRVGKLLNLLPWSQRYAAVTRLNWRLGSFLLRRAARSLPAPSILWIYDPRGADAIGMFGERFAVYDCVDDYVEQAVASPRNRAVVRKLDHKAAERSRLVFATTDSLRDLQIRRNPNTHLVPNVADFEHFSPGADRRFALDGLRELPRPVLGFAGNIVESKVDFELLDTLAEAFPAATLLLAGPAEGSARIRLEQLVRRTSNVRWIGLQPYAMLPRVVAAFDVGLIPYRANPYTRNCFPLKLYEYLAAGKPVVASGLPSLRGLEPHVAVTDTANDTVAAVTAALREPEGALAARTAIAAANTWETRTDCLLELVASELSS
jgi:glycosyltransferase involved in cell wall biosynthesis